MADQGRPWAYQGWPWHNKDGHDIPRMACHMTMADQDCMAAHNKTCARCSKLHTIHLFFFATRACQLVQRQCLPPSLSLARGPTSDVCHGGLLHVDQQCDESPTSDVCHGGLLHVDQQCDESPTSDVCHGGLLHVDQQCDESRLPCKVASLLCLLSIVVSVWVL
jgi:hypothetical protein